MLTLVIIAITVITSYLALNNPQILRQMIFNPVVIRENREWYRFFSAGFIHANYLHLGVNMYVLYLFGDIVEKVYLFHFKEAGYILYILLYVLSLAASHTYPFIKYGSNPNYNSLGASGAVSAVAFAYILINPTAELYFIFFPFFPIPAFVLGIIYLVYSIYMGKKNIDNIGHEAHFTGAIFGVLFTIALKPALFLSFIHQIRNLLF